jgi:hypothetical protein
VTLARDVLMFAVDRPRVVLEVDRRRRPCRCTRSRDRVRRLIPRSVPRRGSRRLLQLDDGSPSHGENSPRVAAVRAVRRPVRSGIEGSVVMRLVGQRTPSMRARYNIIDGGGLRAAEEGLNEFLRALDRSGSVAFGQSSGYGSGRSHPMAGW